MLHFLPSNWLPGPRLIPTFPAGSAELSFISTDFPRAASLIALMMEAVQTSETLVKSYQSARPYNLEYSHIRRQTSQLLIKLL
jgi:hypothetical protein